MQKKRSTSEDASALERVQTTLESKSRPGDEVNPQKPTNSTSTKGSRDRKKRVSSKGKTEVTVSAASLQPEVPLTALSPEQSSGMVVAESRSVDEAALSPAVSIQERIALLAYSYWEARGRQGGSPEDDWLRAEREVLSSLKDTASYPNG